MYNQVRISPRDRDALRFLWTDGGVIKHYRMTSHLFGRVWCSSSSVYASNKTADLASDPQVKDIITKSFYVDDLLWSTSSIDDAKLQIVITLLIDLKKAFDTIDHRILLRKLYSYGIRGSMLKWMESYLTDRSQYVVFDGKVSQTRGIKCGVPQGSILGPLLFIISVNDICNVSPMLFKILYADDTCVLISGNHLNNLIDRLNTELISLNNWFKANKLSLNTKKNIFL